MVEIYKKNPRALLESYDVEFIQPDYRQPSTVYYFSIPAVMHKFTSAVRLYYLQHMSQFNMCEARVRVGLPLKGLKDSFRKASPVPITTIVPFIPTPMSCSPGRGQIPNIIHSSTC